MPITDKQGTEQILYDESHALLIGASSYYAGWPVLPNVKNDIDKVEQALLQHGFIVTRVIDPDGKQLPAVIDKFVQDHGMAEANRLLIYFAGHGHTVKKKYGEVMGYLVPVDAPNPQVDMKGFLSKSMPIQAIELVAKRIDSKHALFLFDSCFSGSIFSLSRAIPKSISHKTSLPVRQFITSGGAEEQVPDLSIFMRQFVAALNGEGDSDGDGYLTGSELGIFLTDSVINYSKDMQHPQYGKIRNRHLDKGDFVFVLPMKNPQEVKKTIAISLATIEEKDTELMFWDTIKNSSNPNDFKAYIKQFPNGRFVALARIRSGPLPTPTEVLPGQRLTLKKIPVVQAPAPPARVAKKDPELVRQENEKKKQEEIHRLLQQAQSHIDAYRLTTPKNRNAIFIIRKILNLSPGNQPAIQKLKEITDTYVELGQQAMESHNLNKAKLRYRHGLNIAKEFNLPEQNLSSLNLEITEYLAKKEAKAQKAETAAREKKKKQQKLAKKKQKEKELAEKERKKKELIVKKRKEKERAEKKQKEKAIADKKYRKKEKELAEKKRKEQEYAELKRKERQQEARRRDYAEQKSREKEQIQAKPLSRKDELTQQQRNEMELGQQQFAAKANLRNYKKLLAAGFEAVRQKRYTDGQQYHDQAKELARANDLPVGQLKQLQNEINQSLSKKKRKVIGTF